MSLNTKNSCKLSVKRAKGRRRRRRSSRRTICSLKARRSLKEMEAKSRLSHKLEALKNLIPPQNGEIVKAEQLFQETADYIVLLKTRVVILQKLIDFYGNSENEKAVL